MNDGTQTQEPTLQTPTVQVPVAPTVPANDAITQAIVDIATAGTKAAPDHSAFPVFEAIVGFVLISLAAALGIVIVSGVGMGAWWCILKMFHYIFR